MKILWLASWYPNRIDKFNGDFIQRQAQAASQFCKIKVFHVKKDENLPHGTVESFENESDNLSEHVIYYNSRKTPIGILNKLFSFIAYNKHYRNAIKAYLKTYGKPDYVHVHVAMNAGVVSTWIKKKWHIPYFVTEHWAGYYHECVPSLFNKNFIFRYFNRRILKNASLFFPVSQHLGETIKKSFIDIPYEVIPNVVNTSFFNYKMYNPAKFRFIHISYMNFQKNPEGIFTAAEILKKRGYNFELLMLGNENELLTALAKKYNLMPQTVFFQNAVPYAKVASCMQEASALLLFSRFENLPCVLLEALCCGLPVISSNVGGIAEVICKSNGILVESENTGALANAMEKMIKEYAKFNKNEIAAEAASKFNYEKVGAQIASFYK